MNPGPDERFPAGTLGRRLTILGSTGSIGLSTLDVVAHARERYGNTAFPIEALTAQSNVELLAQQARRFRPRLVVIGDASRHDDLKTALAGEGIETGAGPEAIVAAAWAAGVSYIDTAPFYGVGQAERCVGDALRDRPRGEWVLSKGRPAAAPQPDRRLRR